MSDEQANLPIPAPLPEWNNKKQARDEYPCTGRWNNEAIFQVLRVFDDKWFSVAELARIAFGSASAHNQEKARNRISRLWHHTRKHHHRVIIKEYERMIVDAQHGELKARKKPLKGHNIIARVKIATVEDIPLADSELDHRFTLNEITRKQLEELKQSLRDMERVEMERRQNLGSESAQ